MVSGDDVRKLARLGRVALTDAEVEKFKGDMDSIISYIDTIQKVALSEKPTGSAYLDIHNVMREDTNPHETGIYTEDMLAQAPRRQGDYLKVKKILP